jgi:Mn2+/Fe2+ NRAMP family transporter
MGLVVPRIPDIGGAGLNKTVALLGGVGGTVTVLCYGYWIREEGRDSVTHLNDCRIDLAVGYAMTAIFGISMVIIGAALGEVEGKGATLVVNIANLIEKNVPTGGVVAKWAFLVGAWGAVFSSLLGVWQAVPYLFCDFARLFFGSSIVQSDAAKSDSAIISTGSRQYRVSLLALATIPILGLYAVDFTTAMLVNGIIGALFIPMLAATLLYLCGGPRVLAENANSRWSNTVLCLMLVLFIVTAGFKLYSSLPVAN